MKKGLFSLNATIGCAKIVTVHGSVKKLVLI